MLSFSDVAPGERLVVRYRLSDVRTGEHFSDALGELQEVTEQSVTIQTRTELVRIPREAITHAKRVPPPPARRRPRASRSE
ncbi:putative acetyltransferase [Glutamicibacter arilaitensis]|uniref:putative acetyltransferase n=1 Tax=Glutamicibacter arilaitensis TaxID=256701 RepID=UPI003F93536D